MTDERIENVHVFCEESLLTPEQLKGSFPLSENAVATVMRGQRTIKEILTRRDHRLFAVVGPCSIHDVDAASEYASRLQALAEELQDTLFLVMRVYFEKPRTRVGWQGLLNDPDLDGSGRIEEGLRLGRKLLLELAERGLPAAGEALDLVSPQYVQDLISWTAIGARTTESQTHRKMASGFTSAVGFKNGTGGDIGVAIDAMFSAAHRNHFLSVDPSGRVAVVRTKGNPHTHIVLRGGGATSNYDAESVGRCERRLREAGLLENIMVDCSHDNSQRDPEKQIVVLEEVTRQIEQGNRSIIAVMLESHLEWGNQPIHENPKQLRYGVSVTDPCIDWKTTERTLRDARRRLADLLPSRTARAETLGP
jgi:3-deoxy-7-phosphoheptulonate synthase